MREPHSRFVIVAGVLALLAICVHYVFALSLAKPQTAESYEPVTTFKIKTRIIVLDIVVTDRKGNLVSQPLTRDDFTLVEDGKNQVIRSFEAPSEHRMPASTSPVVTSAADLSKIGDAPVTVLVLDELNSRFEDMSFARQMMVKYLLSQPPILREPTVLLVAKNTTFQQIHDYTQNRDELIGIVRKHMPEYPWRMTNSGKGGPGAVERMAQVLGALQQIAQSSAGTPGRKNLIWVGGGFPSADLVTLDQKTGDLVQAAVRRVITRLMAARITMYTINPAPGTASTLDVQTPADLDTMQNATDSSPFDNGTVNFASLAPSTGGIAYTGRNDLNHVIGEGIAKGDEYYTISYSPTSASEDAAKFRNIKVVLKDRNLVATTRDGYYPATKADLNPMIDKTMPPNQAAANLKLDISAALTSTISYNGLAVTTSKTGAGLYTIRVAEKGIAWTDEGPDGAQHAEATIAAGWYDTKGKLIGHEAREETSPRSNTAAGASYSISLTLPHNVARLRLVVRDAFDGNIGTMDITKF